MYSNLTCEIKNHILSIAVEISQCIFINIKLIWLTKPSSSVMLAWSGWVRRGRVLRTPSGPRGSSGKKVSLGAAGSPARMFSFPGGDHYTFSVFCGKINL